MVIYKYTLKPGLLTFKFRGNVLSVQNQNDNIVVYAEVDDSLPEHTHIFDVIPTGQPFINAYNSKFLGTVMLCGGTYVQHVYYTKVSV